MLLTHESSREKTALLDTDYTKDLSTAALRHHGGFYYVVRISNTSLAARAFSHEGSRSTKAVLFSKSLFRKTYFRKASSVFPGISCLSLTSQGEY